jgi:hypothetical protein
MARVFITGSADGLGRAAAQTLVNDGHEVVVHARNRDRLTAVRDLLDRGAAAIVGDLSNLEETRGLARDVNRLGRLDAVIHNVGVYTGPHVLPVNVVAPYLLTALIDRPQRLVYLSSSEHRSGRPSLTGHRLERPPHNRVLSGQQALCHHAHRCHRPEMGGPGAPDNLRLGHLTQEWLATSEDPEARTSGGYWYHQRRTEPHPAVRDRRFQDQLLEDLAGFTATRLV